MSVCIQLVLVALQVSCFAYLQVDRAFSLYCTIDPLANTLGINIYQFTQFLRDTDMTDAHVSAWRQSTY